MSLDKGSTQCRGHIFWPCIVSVVHGIIMPSRRRICKLGLCYQVLASDLQQDFCKVHLTVSGSTAWIRALD